MSSELLGNFGDYSVVLLLIQQGEYARAHATLMLHALSQKIYSLLNNKNPSLSGSDCMQQYMSGFYARQTLYTVNAHKSYGTRHCLCSSSDRIGYYVEIQISFGPVYGRAHNFPGCLLSLYISLTVVLYEMLPKNPTLQYIKLIQQYIKYNGKKKLLLI